jgi:hypothetical protein
MILNIDNARKSAICAFNSLVTQLNMDVTEIESGRIVKAYVQDISEHLDDLRTSLSAIASCCQDGNINFKALDDVDRKLKYFIEKSEL